MKIVYDEFNPNIWPVPIEKPAGKLGIGFQNISINQIPFYYGTLKKDSVIQNEFGESLYYNGEYYKLITNDPNAYLENWFCKWKNISMENSKMKENKEGFSHLDYMELALRACDIKMDKKLISLILRLNEEKPLEELSIKDIVRIRMENDKDFENE